MKIYFIIVLLSINLFSICKTPINIASKTPIALYEIIHIISAKCKLSLFIEDKLTKSKLDFKFNTIYLSEQNLSNSLSYLLKEHFYYSLQDNKLKISYLQDTHFTLHHISDNLSFDTKIKNEKNQKDKKPKKQTIIKDNFWENLNNRLNTFIKDKKQYRIIVDKLTGNIFIRADKKITKSIKKYISRLKKEMSKQVLIDMNIYKVSLNKGYEQGINWSLLKDIQSFKLQSSIKIVNNKASNSLNIGKDMSVDSIVDFINRFGNTSSLSNPKLLLLNNQIATISIGNEIYYKINKSSITNGSNPITTKNEEINSVFSGLNIKIKVSIEDDMMILKINQSISSISQNSDLDNMALNIPPNKRENKISTTIRLKNKEKAIIGGLISTNDIEDKVSIVVLGAIPLIGDLFTNTKMKKISNEFILVIEGRIW